MRMMKRALIVFGAWTVVALLFTIQMRYQVVSQGNTRSWSWIISWQLAGWWTWALFTAPVCAFAAWAVRVRRPLAIIAAHVPMALLIGVACAGLEGAVKWALGLSRTPRTFVGGITESIATY